MKSTGETQFYKEPTHDEIALNAFLAWERDGYPQSSDLNYWLEAEARLRAQRRKQAEAAAAQAAKPWPPQSRVQSVKAKKAAPVVTAPVAKPVVTKKVPKTKATGARLAPVKVATASKATLLPPARSTTTRAAR
jgi:hypothetical protein